VTFWTPRFFPVSHYWVITLRAKLSGAVYCYRSCLWRVGGFVGGCVCGSVTTITRNCVHRSSPNGSVCKGSDRLQLVKFWPSRAPGKGSAAGRNFLGLTTASAQCLRLWALFSFGVIMACIGLLREQFLSFKSGHCTDCGLLFR